MNDEALRDIFERAAELTPAEHAAFLAEACGDNMELRQEIEALLAADADASKETFWQYSALRNQVLAEGDAGSAVGETIGHYRLVELVGKGGMGAVYRAERVDAAYAKCVAVKLIHGFFHSAEVIAHFRAERQILANLEHANIARLLDGGARADGSPYLIMEYIEGVSPYVYCREHDLSSTARLALFRQICSAVHFAHQHMVIHRDLKPANILVTPDGTPKLLDFGIAKVLNPDPLNSGDALTGPGMLKLTARYASPEQIRGDAATTASDVYSLGVILYELLAGHSPYGDADRPTHQLMTAVCEEQPARPSHWQPKLKGDLDNIVLRALRKNPGERYASVDQFSEDIFRFLEGRPVEARGDAPLYVATKFVRRNRVVVAAACLVLCSLIVGLVEVTLARRRADRRFNQVRQLAHAVMFDYADAIDQLPGATPVRERLVQDALTYQDSLAKEADTPELQREVVDGYVRVSGVQGNEYENNLGDTAAALLSAQKGAAEAARLLRRDHSVPALDSAASAFSTEGSLYFASGHLPEADQAYRRAVDLRREIARQLPDARENGLALASCLDHLGDLAGGIGFESMGKTGEAAALYDQEKGVVADLRKKFPGNIDVQKRSYSMLLSTSALEDATGKHQESLADLGEAVLEIESVFAAEPRNTTVKVNLANAESRLGQVFINAREASLALPHVTQSETLLQELSMNDPGNAVFRRGLFTVEAEWAAALRGAGNPTEGLVHNRKAVQLAESLQQSSPNSLQYRTDVGVNERKLAEGLLATGDAKAALAAAGRAEAALCAEAAGASSPNRLANCGRTQLITGNTLLALHNPIAAELSMRKAESIASGLANGDPKSAVFRSDAARSQAGLAAALEQAGDAAAATQMYRQALQNWSVLRRANSITAEDSRRCELATLALAAFSKPQTSASSSHP